MLIGAVYRLRVTNIRLAEGIEVFPTIEVIDRLYPPPGQECRFAIPVELTEEDLKLAIDGKFVTRVIFLEDPAARPAGPREPERPELVRGGAGPRPAGRGRWPRPAGGHLAARRQAARPGAGRTIFLRLAPLARNSAGETVGPPSAGKARGPRGPRNPQGKNPAAAAKPGNGPKPKALSSKL